MKRVHQTSSDNSSQYHCIVCACSFKRVGSLSAHITKYHPDLERNIIAEDMDEFLGGISDEHMHLDLNSAGLATGDKEVSVYYVIIAF